MKDSLMRDIAEGEMKESAAELKRTRILQRTKRSMPMC